MALNLLHNADIDIADIDMSDNYHLTIYRSSQILSRGKFFMTHGYGFSVKAGEAIKGLKFIKYSLTLIFI